MHEGLHESLRKYISIADVFKNAAERQYQLPLPEQTYQAWKSTLAAMRMVDYGFDSLKTQYERQLFKNRILAFMQGEENFEMNGSLFQNYLREFRGHYQQLPIEKQRSLLINARLIFNLGEMIKNTSDINEFSKLTRLEGQVTSRLIFAFLPESYQKD